MRSSRVWSAGAVLVTASLLVGATPNGSPVELIAPVTRMGAARAAHTATTLADGQVLVAGGFVTKGSPVGAELFEAPSGRFHSLPAMVETRHSHTATRLRDGRVLIVGGYGEGGATLDSAEVFEPATRRFVRTGPLAAARADHVAVLLDDGRVLVTGGLGPGWTFLASSEIYDPVTGRFTSTGPMQAAREGHAGVLLRDGRVLVVGGHQGRRADMVVHASAETFDARTGRFSRVGDLGIRRHKHDAVLLRDGRVLVTGGADERDDRGVYDTTEYFDAAAGAFRPGPRLALPRYKHEGTSVLLDDGRVLIAGGAPRPEIVDPSQHRSVAVAVDLRMPGLFAAAAAMPGGAVLITGGYGHGHGPVPEAWRFRP